MVKSWLLADSTTDQTSEWHRDTPQFVSLDELEKLGVLYYQIPVDNREEGIEAICKQRGYDYKDEIVVSRKTLPNYEDKIKSFFEEHLHSDEEVRYVVDGAGYFDVRNAKEEWVRIFCEPGDLIVLPEGIYHRFAVTEEDYIHAVRLFTGQKVWTSYNRSAITENMQQRAAYRAKYILSS